MEAAKFEWGVTLHAMSSPPLRANDAGLVAWTSTVFSNEVNERLCKLTEEACDYCNVSLRKKGFEVRPGPLQIVRDKPTHQWAYLRVFLKRLPQEKK